MKLFLVFLLMASCQAMSLSNIPGKVVTKEDEFKPLVKDAEQVVFKQLIKEYPNEDYEILQEQAREIAIAYILKHEFSAASYMANRGSEMAEVEYGAIERRDIWDQLNDTLHRIVGHLRGKFSDLKDFFHNRLKIGAEKLKPHLINIKKLAQDLLNNVSEVSKKVAKQAIEFFRPFHQKLGELWLKLVKAIDGHFHTDQRQRG